LIPTELWVICALVFGAVLLGFQGIYWVLFKERREKQAINRRLALAAELANPKEVLEILRKERGVSPYIRRCKQGTGRSSGVR
jgi:tight adherence protein B